MFGDKAEVRRLTQRLAQAHIVIEGLQQNVDDLNASYMASRADVDDLTLELAEVHRNYNRAVECGVIKEARS